MKTTLIFMITLFSSITASTQVLNYFGNNPEWRLWVSGYAGMECGIEEEKVYYLFGDSIVDGITYHKLFERGIASEFYVNPESPPCSGSWTFDHLIALIRQEEKRIYVKYLFDSFEELWLYVKLSGQIEKIYFLIILLIQKIQKTNHKFQINLNVQSF